MSKQAPYQKKLLFVGGGNMAYAFAAGLVKNNAVSAELISVCDIDPEKLHKFESLGINVGTEINTLCTDAEIIFIAVKPGAVSLVMRSLAAVEGLLDRAVIVSFAAAVGIDFITRSAGRSARIIRTMPSTPVLVGEGVIAVTCNELVSKKEFEGVCRMLSTVAYVVNVDEAQMNSIISVHGSSPAYVFLFIKAMLEGAEKQGIPVNIALPLILRTIKGSVTMIEKSDESVEQLINNVASPGGTTRASLDIFAERKFCDIISEAMDACTSRADEISDSLT